MRISIARMASSDPVCFVPSILAVGAWAMLATITLAEAIQGRNVTPQLPGPAAATLLFSLSTLALCRMRAHRFEEIVATGTRVTARVEQLVHSQFWVNVRLAYEHDGEPRTRKLLLASLGRVEKRLREAETVTLVVSPSRPGAVVILDLYD